MPDAKFIKNTAVAVARQSNERSSSSYSLMPVPFAVTLAVCPVSIVFRVFGFYFVFLYPISPFLSFRGHKVSSSPSSPTTVLALHFYREKTSAFFSFVDSHRTAMILIEIEIVIQAGATRKQILKIIIIIISIQSGAAVTGQS